MSKKITTEEFDKIFDEGKEDIIEYLDTENPIRRVNVDFPLKVVKTLDELAKRRGVTRQSLIKMWIYDKIQEEN